MEDAKSFKENGPPLDSPPRALLLVPSDENESVNAAVAAGGGGGADSSTVDAGVGVGAADSSTVEDESDDSTPSPKDLLSFSPAIIPVDDTTTVRIHENKEAMVGVASRAATSFSKSYSSSTLMDNVSSQSRNGMPNGHAVQHFASFKSNKDDHIGAKIVARPSPDDEYSPHHRRHASVDLVARVPSHYSNKSNDSAKAHADGVGPGLTKVHIDTRPPFESVKAAVSKFGGIVDWKAHRVQTVERRKFIEQELERAHEEIPLCKQQCQAAEEAKLQVMKDLECTKRLIEELKLNLERAQREEQQAKQDSELAKLRVEEMEQGIADESSFAAKAQLEVAKARNAAAVSELQAVKDELEQLRGDYAFLVSEKDSTVKKAEEALSTSKEVERSVQNLTIDLITLKQSLDSEHSAHLEAEEHRMGAVMAKEQENDNWEVELKQAQDELEKLNHQMLTIKDLKSRLAEATALLHDLKGELAAYMESKTGEEGDPLKKHEKKSRADIQAAVSAAKKELQEVKLKIDKANNEVNILKLASASLKSDLEKENMELAAFQQREGMALTALASLEAELNKLQSEIALVQMKEREEREKMMELPMQVQEAAGKADQAKALAQVARNEVQRAKDEAEKAKAEARARESKLNAVQKEIEASKASEMLALAAISALEESESAQRDINDDSTSGITLSIEEYYELSKRAREAEEQANMRVAEATSKIEVAKESEEESLDKLEQVSREMSQRNDALEAALQKVRQATEGKLSVEQELRKWREEHEQKRKDDQSVPAPVKTSTSPRKHGKGSKDFSNSSDSSSDHHQKSPKEHTATESVSVDRKTTKKKKIKSFIPRLFMFLGKKKSHSHSSKTD